jgi:hypothetical protein
MLSTERGPSSVRGPPSALSPLLAPPLPLGPSLGPSLPPPAPPRTDIMKGARQGKGERRAQETRASTCTCTAARLYSFASSQKLILNGPVRPVHERCRFRSQNSGFLLAVGATVLYGLRFTENFTRCRTALRIDPSIICLHATVMIWKVDMNEMYISTLANDVKNQRKRSQQSLPTW